MFRLLFLFIATFMVQLSFAQSLSTQQQAFVDTMSKQITNVDHYILQERQIVLHDQAGLLKNKHLPYKDYKNIVFLGSYYRVKSCNPLTWQAKSCVNTLLKRVDILPTDLVLAQAINESNWGQSRFAKEGNNYFGIWCFTKGCGMVPGARPKGQSYEVRRFVNMRESILAYYRIINTHASYQTLRDLRAQMRKENKSLSAYVLAAGLEGYSTKRQAYVRAIRSIIGLLTP